jgi:DnaJ-domain-containing protein 1
MSFNEIAIIVGCLVTGYWAVNKYLEQKEADSKTNKYKDGQNFANDFGQKSSSNPSVENDSEYIRNHWNSILGVTIDTPLSEIAAAYKSKMSQYHPDKCASLGPELRELAEQKAKQINAAYEHAKHLKG